MSVEQFFFYLIGGAAVLGGLGVVLTRNIVHAALALILALLAVAGVFILLTAEFLALVQVLIYGAAVALLILFALMLTRAQDMPEAMVGPQWPLGALGAAALAGLLIGGAAAVPWGAPDRPNLVPTQQIGESLFTNWLAPFEIVALVLVVALVGAIIVASREEQE
ncbi:MAG TPA: NADH-quinone oxidoreductase subunit J [Dehalococcoidia bacterium]|nr:NADH-quinone oxidoreductase subunit J [Dehalococcoidia bacterium]